MPPRLSAIDIEQARRALARSDSRLRPWLTRIETPRLSRNHTAFASLCRAVIAQQLSNRAAKTICDRFFAGAAKRGPRPEAVLARRDESLRALGLSRQKVRYVRGLAEAFAPGGALHRYPFASRSDEAVIEALVQHDGIGRWTAEMFLIFWLHRPDIFSAGDLALRNAVARVEGVEALTPKQCSSVAERWAPYRTVASLYLWRIAHYRDS